MAKRKFPILMMLPPVLFIGLAVLFFLGMERENPNELPSAFVGRAAPAVQLTPLGEGATITDADIAAEGVKLVNFWASWCAPCRAEHPMLEDLAAEGVTIYGINYKDEPANALGFLDELGNPYTAIAADAQGRTALEWGVYGVPETYVIDGQGRILHRTAGPLTRQIVERDIRPLLTGTR
ncbi:DsbE family thiol:disulfide interchange protein [Actibacterium sp. XHP0104]|uniref:DsbE family thiol:disulfide interchange protein n=1 Tax=Actibacterium sp. XHP0104 TaxID=2984335 RepID=UPI0021E78B12|nr:DsbE family thiol:disulfide interchange protein [Actibacterium sp. XHP0104]MCV2880916.1 DsbE family thiol:disulfide interchange protein [Actibacterium sp. XHP0104]